MLRSIVRDEGSEVGALFRPLWHFAPEVSADFDSPLIGAICHQCRHRQVKQRPFSNELIPALAAIFVAEHKGIESQRFDFVVCHTDLWQQGRITDRFCSLDRYVHSASGANAWINRSVSGDFNSCFASQSILS
jgi:hypothetical protein